MLDTCRTSHHSPMTRTYPRVKNFLQSWNSETKLDIRARESREKRRFPLFVINIVTIHQCRTTHYSSIFIGSRIARDRSVCIESFENNSRAYRSLFRTKFPNNSYTTVSENWASRLGSEVLL